MDEPKGCCKCSVTKSAIIVAVIQIVLSVLVATLCIILLSLSTSENSKLLTKDSTKQNTEEIKYGLRLQAICGLIGSAVHILLSGLVIFGIINKKPKYLMPYIAWGFFTICVYLLLGVIILIIALTNIDAHGGYSGVLDKFIGLIIGNAISLYFVLTVRDAYTYLRIITLR